MKRHEADPTAELDYAALSDAELREVVDSRGWYHTIELRPGIVTPGWFDLRELAASLPIPRSLAGRRALDVGTFEGFWAAELAARGADDVLAIDVLDPRDWDWPVGSDPATVAALNERKQSGAGFDVVEAVLQRGVSRMDLSVYDLDPQRVGLFDFVYVGSLLLHLRDPVLALQRVRSVLRPGGQVLVVDAIDVDLTLLHPRRPVAHLDGDGRPWWWRPNARGLQQMVAVAGFDIVRPAQRVYLPFGAGHHRVTAPTLRSLLHSEGRHAVVMRRRGGDPHAAVLARRPAGS